MRRSDLSRLLLLLTALPVAVPPGRAVAEDSKPEAPKAAAFGEILTGAARSGRQRRNLFTRFQEVMAAHKKERRKLIEEGREKVLRRSRREAKEAMEKAYATLGRVAEGLLKLAEDVRDNWEVRRKAETDEVARLKTDREAQKAWVHKRGFTRADTEEAAAAFVFSDERCQPLPPASTAYLQSLGFDSEESEVILLVLELADQVASRLETQGKPSKP